MQSLNDISKEELIDLLAATVDGIDGVESEYGAEELLQFWNVDKLERARRIVDEMKAV